MILTTADRYFTLFPESFQSASKPSEVAKINMRIISISRNVETYLGRSILKMQRTEYFTPEKGSGTKSVRLRAYPVESIDLLTIFEDEMTDDYFRVNNLSGQVSFSFPVERLELHYENAIVVKYTGGMAEDTDDFINQFPDIEMEVLMQVNFEVKRSADIAMKSVANGQTTSQLTPYGFLDSLIAVLDRHKKSYES